MPTIFFLDGGQNTNPNSNKLLKFSSEKRIIISPPAEPTFQRSGGQLDIVDVALISNLPIHHLVLHELDYDHIPVIYTLNEQTKANNQILKLINASINWESFRKTLMKNSITKNDTETWETSIRVLNI